jgi:DNA-3-methyladenine glycosylase II
MRRAVAHLKKSDPKLAAVIARVGACRMPRIPPTFPFLVRAIVFQQLHGNAARAIFDRLVTAAGGELTPEWILRLSEGEMRALGLSKQKLSYIRDLAARTQSGEIDFARLPKMSEEEVIDHLTRVKGIGVWSAQMFLIFALRRPDVMPTGDFGVRSAIQKLYRKRKLPKPDDLLKVSRAWQPYRSIACWYLWRSLDSKA